MKKKILTFLLVMCMLLGMTSVALAAGESAEDPITLGFQGSPVEVTIPNGGTETGVYYTETAIRQGDYSLMVTGDGVADAFVIYNDSYYWPSDNQIIFNMTFDPSATFQICYSNWEGDAPEETKLYVSLGEAIGTYGNPDTLSVSEEGDASASVTLSAGSFGYYYLYTATVDAQIAVSASAYNADWEATGYEFMILDKMDAPYSGMTGDEYVEVVDVNAGETLMIVVNTSADGMPPAGQVYLNIEPFFPEGTEYNPISHDNSSKLTYTGTLTANTTTYFLTYFRTASMKISGDASFKVVLGENEYESKDGVVTVEIPAADIVGYPQPEYFTIVSGAADVDYTITYEYKPGHSTNPDKIEAGIHETVFGAGASEYYYTWTAPSDGTVTMGVSSTGGWMYAIDKVQEEGNVVGDWCWSDDKEVVASQTMKVSKGEVYIIRVVTYDPEMPWEAPAGTVNVNVEFEADVEDTENDNSNNNDNNDNNNKEEIPNKGDATATFITMMVFLGAALVVTGFVSKKRFV